MIMSKNKKKNKEDEKIFDQKNIKETNHFMLEFKES